MNRHNIVYQVPHVWNSGYWEQTMPGILLQMEKIGGKIHKMYSNRYLNLSHVPGLGLFSSKEEKTHTASARTCVCTHTNALSHKRVSPCAVSDYGQRTVCVLRSVYVCISPDMPSFFPCMSSPWLSPLRCKKNCSCEKSENKKHHMHVYMRYGRAVDAKKWQLVLKKDLQL